jgi:hypothetical protein
MRRGRVITGLAPTSPVGREKHFINRQKAPFQGQKCMVHHGPKYDFPELAGSGIRRAKTGSAADWQRNLAPASLEHGICRFLRISHDDRFNN